MSVSSDLRALLIDGTLLGSHPYDLNQEAEIKWATGLSRWSSKYYKFNFYSIFLFLYSIISLYILQVMEKKKSNEN